MKKLFAVLASSTLAFGAATGVQAQTVPAMELAIQLNACVTAPPISARYLDSGRLEVTCPAGSVSGTGGLGTTGLSTGAALGLGAAAIVLIIAIGGDSNNTTIVTPVTN